MKKWWTKVEDVAERCGFSCIGSSNYDYFCFSQESPAGHDFNIEIEAKTLDELKEELKEFVYNYDVSEEAYIWLDNFGHGKNGAPYDMKDVYEDMEWCRDEAEKLADEISNIQ